MRPSPTAVLNAPAPRRDFCLADIDDAKDVLLFAPVFGLYNTLNIVYAFAQAGVL